MQALSGLEAHSDFVCVFLIVNPHFRASCALLLISHSIKASVKMYKIKYHKRYRVIEKNIILGDANTSLERQSLHQSNSRILSIRKHLSSNGS